MTNTLDKTITDKTDTSEEAVERLCRDITAMRKWYAVADGKSAVALIRALCAERDERTEELQKTRAILTTYESELSSLRAKWAVSEEAIAEALFNEAHVDTKCNPPASWEGAAFEESRRYYRRLAHAVLAPIQKGCGVSEEAIARAICHRYHRDGNCWDHINKKSLCLTHGDCTDWRSFALEAREVLTLLQSAPQDAKPAPMDGEVAKVSREYVLSALRWREVSEFDGRGRNGLTIEQTADLICDRLANALESFSRRNEGDGERWRHKKRGTTYTIVGNAQVQAEEPLTDYEVVKVYRCEQTGELWVRRRSEFNDGRFEQVPLPPPPETAKEAQR